eukprot:jgi/Orpsp1_1/1191544/evm.model.d7180000086852.1
MSSNSININLEKSFDTSKSSQMTNKAEQLNSTAKVFCEAVNQIVKAYLDNYNEKNIFQTINLSFAQKVIIKTRISFSQLVVTLVYLNRYYESIINNKKHIPGHEKSKIPSLSHVVLLCIIQAERYITDIPHKLSWWANICAGQTKTIDINRWQRDFFDTINYKLYVHPEKDYNTFKFQIKRLAARLFNYSLNMPQQFRRSVNLGSQLTPTTASSTSSNKIPSQPNVISTSNSVLSSTQPKILLSPLYSGNSNIIHPTAIFNGQTNIISSPLNSIHSDNSFNNHPQQNNLNVPVLNITNTNLTTSPVELNMENSMINQMRSPNSIYSNSQHSIPLENHNQLHVASPLPPTQNPNNLMVITNMIHSPSKKTISLTSSSTDNEKESSTSNKNLTTQSPSQISTAVSSFPVQITSTNLINSPVDMTKNETNDSKKTVQRVVKRKRSYYDPLQISSVTAQFIKVAQGIKRTKMSMTISPEEIDYHPQTPSSRPIEEKNNMNSMKYFFQNKESSLNQNHRFRGDEQSFQTLDKGKSEESIYTSSSSSNSIPYSKEKLSSDVVENSFVNSLENIPSTTISNDINSFIVNNTNTSVSNEEIIVSLLASNNSTAITLIPVSPPLTPK